MGGSYSSNCATDAGQATMLQQEVEHRVQKLEANVEVMRKRVFVQTEEERRRR
jgi:hypothetical protein